MANPPFAHLAIILVRPQHSGNIGGVARAIANHGLGQLRLVDPPALDPDRARWMAPHARHLINSAQFFPSVPASLTDSSFVIGATARQRKWNIPSWNIQQLCQHISTNRRTALLFGPEDSGLSNDDIQHCHAVITLPTYEHQSLNLSQAVNVIGGHLQASLPEEPPEALPAIDKHLTMKLQQQLLQTSLDVLRRTAYLKGRNEYQVHNQLLQLIERVDLQHEEAAYLKGMLNKVYHGFRVLGERLQEKK